MTAKISGGCACGAVRYEIAADPQFQGQCQCRDCQRATGTGHADGLGFPQTSAVRDSDGPMRGPVRYKSRLGA